jgi:hypothetical protein
VSWLDDQLAAAGIQRTGAVEIGLYELLHRTVPDRVLAPIAIDMARGWIVLPGVADMRATTMPTRFDQALTAAGCPPPRSAEPRPQ